MLSVSFLEIQLGADLEGCHFFLLVKFTLVEH